MARADSTTSTSMPACVQAERGRKAADPAAGDEHAHQRCAPNPVAGNCSCTIISGRPCERIA